MNPADVDALIRWGLVLLIFGVIGWWLTKK